VSTFRPFDSPVWFTDVTLDDYTVRGVLIVGTERAFVWDTLSHPRDMGEYAPLIGGRQLVIAYSHADWDHIWGTAGLPHEGAVILGHRSCLARFGADVPATLRDKRAAEPDAWDGVRLVAPNSVFDTETSFDLGGATVVLRHLPGHTPDSVVAYVAAYGLLLMGDAAETPFPVVPVGSPLREWITGLRRWESEAAVRTVVPAHGAAGGREILRSNILYLEGLRDGHPVDAAGPLTNFYRDTHRANLRARGLVP